MSDHWTTRLSEYLDDELSAAERSALESHLGECSRCGRTLDELRTVVSKAAAVEDGVPERDLWPGIAARLTPRGGAPVIPLAAGWQEARRPFTWGHLVAAAVVGMLVSGAGVWAALGVGGAAVGAAAAEPAGPAAPMSVHYAAGDYDATVEELERLLSSAGGALDSATVRVLRENLRIIDRALDDARAALEADPASPYLNAHLASAMRRKAELLRRATALAQL